MQKENPVIKNYILSSKKRVLIENPPVKSVKYIYLEQLLINRNNNICDNK